MEPRVAQRDFRQMAAEVLFFKAFKEYIYTTMPIRLIKLPEEEFMDRDGVFCYLKDKIAVSNNHQDLLNSIASTIGPSEVAKIPDQKYTHLIAEGTIKKSLPIQKFFQAQTSFAILSHTWIPKPPENQVADPYERELLFEDTQTIVKGNSKIRIVSPGMRGPGFDKFKKFCHVARETYAVEFAWMDTVCINKPAETNESIGSMFKWYSSSSICIVHLTSTTSDSETDIASDPWFKRGWTLQELLVPRMVVFVKKNWLPLISYNKDDGIRRMKEQKMTKIIHEVTGISADELYGFAPGLVQGIPSRMVWIAKRVTTKQEDIAYSVMGVFGVVFLTDYSEGRERAFFHLLEAIIQKSVEPNTLSIFNYTGQSVSDEIHKTNILPSDPTCYLQSNISLNKFTHYAPLKSNPLELGPNGLKVRLVLVFAVLNKSFSESVANGLGADGPDPVFTCVQNSYAKIWANEPVVVQLFHNSAEHRAKLASNNCFLFGIWNFVDKEDEIILPNICPAFLLQLKAPPRVSFDLIGGGDFSPASKVDTDAVILLMKRKGRPSDLKLRKEDLKLFNLSYVECRL